MNTRIITVILATALAIPLTVMAKEPGARKEQNKAHRQEQRQENQAFRETLKDLPAEQRQAAIIEHRNSQFAENVAHHEQMHQEQMTKLQAKLAANSELTDAQKQEILNQAEQSYQEKVTKFQEQHQANMNFAQQIANDPNLTPEQKREKMQEHRQTNKENMKQQHAENKQKRETRREEHRKKRQTQQK
ncbi:MAG: hypothetical protein H6753_01865 [Candidatus Omnitrophica bacterium]|nr:hypothetical protein [Candidatus Omnitrophota bacterium]